jgi:hypothetical protein
MRAADFVPDRIPARDWPSMLLADCTASGARPPPTSCRSGFAAPPDMARQFPSRRAIVETSGHGFRLDFRWKSPKTTGKLRPILDVWQFSQLMIEQKSASTQAPDPVVALPPGYAAATTSRSYTIGIRDGRPQK